VRMVLVKRVDERGFGFHTNLESRKGGELAANPRAALLFHWRELGRQVRIEGTVERVSDAEAGEYFSTRPRESRLAAWASPQSRPVADRAELDELYRRAEELHAGGEVPLPPHWGGFRVVPDAYEFWQHGENRLHDRVRYGRDGGVWRRERLAP
jgi:pyridoxamine 5'-phosphate oxidase